MLKNPQGTHITEKVIKQNNQNFEIHFPEKIDKYDPEQVLKKKQEKMQSLIDQGKPKYFTTESVDPHILMKSLARQINMSDDQKINMLTKTVNRIERMHQERMAAAEGGDQAIMSQTQLS